LAETKTTAKTAVLLEETRIFEPPKELVENSNVMKWMKERGFKTEKEMRLWCSANYIQFWGDMAKTYADWFEPWSSILEWKPPYARWYVGAKCNVTYNCVDRHAKGAKKDKVAYIFVPEPTDQPTRKITYGELYKEVNKFANGLKSLGVKKGDRVTLYMPMIPELPIAMLACAKIGAIHSIVFSGFSSGGLNSRILDAEAKVVVTTDGLYRRGKPIPLKPNVDEATSNTPSVEKVVVFKRIGMDIPMKAGRDIYWHDLVAGKSDECECEKMDSEDRLFILYTSGTTGKPKGIEHVHGGYQVGPAQTLHWVFDLKENDVWWCTADIGWITGHSYIVYGPLVLGATCIMYEGAPDFPDFGRWYKIIQDNKVSVLYTAPTSVRMFMKAGEQWAKKYDLSSLRLLDPWASPSTRRHGSGTGSTSAATNARSWIPGGRLRREHSWSRPCPSPPSNPDLRPSPCRDSTSTSLMRMPTRCRQAAEAISSAPRHGHRCCVPSSAILRGTRRSTGPHTGTSGPAHIWQATRPHATRTDTSSSRAGSMMC